MSQPNPFPGGNAECCLISPSSIISFLFLSLNVIHPFFHTLLKSILTFCYVQPSPGFTRSHLGYVVLELISLPPSSFPPQSILCMSVVASRRIHSPCSKGICCSRSRLRCVPGPTLNHVVELVCSGRSYHHQNHPSSTRIRELPLWPPKP